MSQLSPEPPRRHFGVCVVWFGRGGFTQLSFLGGVKSDVDWLALIKLRSPGSLKWSNWEEGSFKR